jgi:outer membrane protein
MRKKRILLPIFSFLIFLSAAAQDKWDLRRCVEYAWANNISVRQSDIQARLAEVQLNQDKWARYPSANFQTQIGMTFGRSIDPTTNTFINQQALINTYSLNAGVDIFNWHRLKNNVIASQYEVMASRADVDKIKNDIALNVATFYLQVLLARKQADIARVQMEQSRNQMILTRRKVSAGSLPEVDALSLEGQYANDSSTYITAIATADQNLLDLKALLNLDAASPFDIVTPPVDNIPVEPILELQPDKVYETALTNQPAQKANELRLQSLTALTKSAKALSFPSISFGGGLGTRFSQQNAVFLGEQLLGFRPVSSFSPRTNVGGTFYGLEIPVTVPITRKRTFSEYWDSWGSQLNENFGQNFGLTITVPILNGGQARFAYQRSKLNVVNQELVKEQANQTLKNDIYKAYYQATAALQRFNASTVAVAAAQKTYDFAVRRHELNMLSTFDLITSQNNLTRARLDNALSQFDYVFKMKVLEFWKGLGIRL